MNQQKRLRTLRLLSYVSAILVVVFIVNYDSFLSEENKEEPIAGWCGVVDAIEFKGESVKEGRKLFRQLCSSCHKMDKNFIGPALGGITERRDSTYLYTYITNQDSLAKSNSEIIRRDSLSITNHKFSQLTREMVNDILEYTKY